MLPLNLYARVRILYVHLHARPRVQRAPGFPCALCFLRVKSCANLGHLMPRECGPIPSRCLTVKSEDTAITFRSELSVTSTRRLRRSSGSRAHTQFSTLIPGMRLNSRKLLVTIIKPSLRA
jgi:hypothetical protein